MVFISPFIVESQPSSWRKGCQTNETWSGLSVCQSYLSCPEELEGMRCYGLEPDLHHSFCLHQGMPFVHIWIPSFVGCVLNLERRFLESQQTSTFVYIYIHICLSALKLKHKLCRDLALGSFCYYVLIDSKLLAVAKWGEQVQEVILYRRLCSGSYYGTQFKISISSLDLVGVQFLCA